MAKIYIFNRSSGANGLGHVGWAYDNPRNGSVICGATENPKGTPFESAATKGFWVEAVWPNQVVSLFAKGRNLPEGFCPPYNRYKVLEINNPNPDSAWNKVCWVKAQDFAVSGIPRGRNCMDDSFDILVAFGAGFLPWPTFNPVPNMWFDAIQARPYSVSSRTMDAASLDGIPELPAEIEGSAPVWRQAGSPEYDDFNTITEDE